LPRSAKEPPSGLEWIHEIKHDGFRILARRETTRARLYTRNGYDFTARFPKIAATVESLRVHSCVLDCGATQSALIEKLTVRQTAELAAVAALDLPLIILTAHHGLAQRAAAADRSEHRQAAGATVASRHARMSLIRGQNWPRM
jgi:hypothetical protein